MQTITFSLRILIYSTLLTLIYQSNAQTPSVTNADDFIVYNPHNSVVVDLPTYSSIGPMGKPTVDKNTGALNYSVSITSIECGPHVLPVNLSYTGSGFRPSDYSKEAGLGWSISIGGSISRVVNGRADESSQGFWNTPPIPSSRDNNYLYEVIQGFIDTKPDYFKYNLPSGESGTFIIDKNGDIYHYPVADVKIEKVGTVNNVNFIITNKIGHRFYFEDAESIENNPSDPSAIPSNYKTNWLLTKIKYPDFLDSIQINYVSNCSQIRDWADSSSFSQTITTDVVDFWACSSSDQPDPKYIYNSSSNYETTYSKRISSIITNSQEIVFEMKAGFREDDGIHSTGDCFALDRVVKKINGQEYYCVKFNTSYFTGSKRLKLDGLSFGCSGGMGLMPDLKFEYFEHLFPNPVTLSIDKWGFYNGKNNLGLIPFELIPLFPNIPGQSLNTNYFGDRSFSDLPEHFEIGLLNKIEDPNGNIAEIAYESHDYGYEGDSPISEEIVMSSEGYLECPSGCIRSSNFNAIPGSMLIISYSVINNTGTIPQYADYKIFLNNNLIVEENFPTNHPQIYSTEITQTSNNIAIESTTNEDVQFEVFFHYVTSIENVVTKKGGGARVKSIQHEGIGLYENMEYFYIDSLDMNRSSGSLTHIEQYIKVNPTLRECGSNAEGQPDQGISEMTQHTIFASRNGSYANAIENRIYYKHVIEQVETHDGTFNKVTKFNTPAVFWVYAQDAPPSFTYEFQNPYEVRVYNSDGVLESKSLSDYSQTTINNSLKTLTVEISRNANYLENMQFLDYEVYLGSKWFRLNESTSKTKLSEDDYLETTSQYVYKTNSKILQSETTNSLGDQHQILFKYFGDSGISGPSCMSSTQKHMIGIPLEIETNGQVLSKTKIQYLCNASGAHSDLVLPVAIYKWDYQKNNWQDSEFEIVSFTNKGLPVNIRPKGYNTGQHIVYNWNNSNKLTQSNAFGRLTKYNYNSFNKLEQIEYPDNQITSFTYDGLRRLEKTNNGKSETSYTYTYGQTTGENKVSSIIDIFNGNYSFSEVSKFDGHGRNIHTEINGYKTAVQVFDGFGRMISSKDPQSSYFTSSMYEAGPSSILSKSWVEGWPRDRSHATNIENNKLKKTTIDENGIARYEILNGFGRLLFTSQTIGSDIETLLTYDYDAFGNIESVLNAAGEAYIYTYDGEHRMISKSIPHEGTYTYEYYPQGWLKKESRPDGNVFEFTYNNWGEMTEMNKCNGSTCNDLFIKNVYGSTGPSTGKVIFKNVKLLGTTDFINYEFKYDGFGRVEEEKITHPYGSDEFIYTIDGADNITDVYRKTSLDGQEIELTDKYVYDAYGRNTRVFQKIGAGNEEQLFRKDYNGIDQVSFVKFGPDNAFLLAEAYSYNIRDWMDKINGGCETCPRPQPEPNWDQYAQLHPSSNFQVHYNEDDIVDGVPTMIQIKATLIYEENNVITDTYHYDHIFPYNGVGGDTIFTDSVVLYVNNEPDIDFLAGELNERIMDNSPRIRINNEPPKVDPGKINTALNGNLNTIFDKHKCVTSHVFAQSMEYIAPIPETPGASEQYTGNINQLNYCVFGRNGSDTYGFAYDEMNRLTEAYYPESTENDEGDFNVSITYNDLIGNIKTIQRNGLVEVNPQTGEFSFGLMDDLRLVYDNTGLLLSVNEGGEPDFGFQGGDGGIGYQFGRITSAPEIGAVTYNEIGLPSTILGPDGDELIIVYDAEGVKWYQEKKFGPEVPEMYEDTDDTEIKVYSRGLESINGEWLMRHFEHGRSIIQDTLLRHEYYMRDHLGNIRVVFSDLNRDGIIDLSANTEEILETYSYYPFGMEMEGVGSIRQAEVYQPLGYNSKERMVRNVYDYGARIYISSIGRWNAVDPLAEEFPSWSPYTYTFNNPIRFIDPDGRAPDDIIIRGTNNSSITIATDLIDVDVNAGSIVGDLGGNYTLQGTDVTIAALDIVGIVDPTGVADVAAATLEAQQGNYGSAILSGMGVVPLIGDLGKVGKVGKHVKTIEKAIDGAKAKNLKEAAEKGIPKSQLGPSGKPKIHTVSKPNLKQAKDAARNNPKSNTSPVKHSSDKGQKTHYHSTKDGKKMTGKDNVHYENRSSKRNPN